MFCDSWRKCPAFWRIEILFYDVNLSFLGESLVIIVEENYASCFNRR